MKIIASQPVKKFPTFYGPEFSLPYSQEPANGSCPEPDESSPQLPTFFPKIHSNIIMPSTPRSSSGVFPSGSPTIKTFNYILSNAKLICRRETTKLTTSIDA